MSNKGRDRSNQLVAEEVSVDFTKCTQLLLAHEHEQRDSANETIEIITDNSLSAVNCPIKVGIVPLSLLASRPLLIHKANCCYQHTNTNSANETILIVTYNSMSAVNCSMEVGIVPFSWFKPRFLLIHNAHTAVISNEHKQRDSANETIEIITDNSLSAVNCPIKVGMVPINWLLWRYLSI